MSDYLQRVQRGVDYIEERLDESVGLDDVARAAGISRWHFQRTFKALTGETLKTYIRSRRMAASLQRLRDTDLRILDIALLAGFESQEAFSRAFRKAFEMTPQQYRRIGRRTLFLDKVRFDEAYLRHINGNVSVEPVISERPAMLCVGLRTSYYGIDSDKNDIGERLPPLWSAFLPRLGEIRHAVPGACYGVVRQEREGEERLEYYAAMPVERIDDLPPGMEAVEVPASRYAAFLHRGVAADIDRTVNYIYSTWLAGSGCRHSYGVDLEIYGDGYHPTSADSSFHYAIPLEAS